MLGQKMPREMGVAGVGGIWGDGGTPRRWGCPGEMGDA